MSRTALVVCIFALIYIFIDSLQRDDRTFTILLFCDKVFLIFYTTTLDEFRFASSSLILAKIRSRCFVIFVLFRLIV